MTAALNGVKVMPTFVFYKNRKKVDEMQGADATSLEDRINQWIGGAVDTMVSFMPFFLNTFVVS